MQALAEKYTAEYLDCLTRFGIESIDRFPKASEHIGEIIADDAEADRRRDSHTRPTGTSGSMSRKDADYGKLSNRKVEDQESGHALRWKDRANEIRRISRSGKPPSRASRHGIRPGAKAGQAGISNARP